MNIFICRCLLPTGKTKAVVKKQEKSQKLPSSAAARALTACTPLAQNLPSRFVFTGNFIGICHGSGQP